MTPKEVRDLLGFGEDQNMALMDVSNDFGNIGKTTCAFFNSSGGVLVCGVLEDGSIQGIKNPAENAVFLEKVLRKGLSPSALLSVEVFEGFLLVDVPEGNDKPFSFNNNIYIRSHAKSRKANVGEIRDMVLEKANEPERWERRTSVNLADADLDSDELTARNTHIRKNHPSTCGGHEDAESILNSLSLARYGQLTNAGDLFFSKNPAVRLPQTRVRATCFTNETSREYRDNKVIEGPLLQVFEETLNFILRNVSRRSAFDGQKMSRDDRYLYPVPAIREGLINAFAHRDYADFSGGIAVNIYPSRLEIRNSGEFPKGINPKNISDGHFIVLRNPDIANVLNLLGFMESVGRGARMIVQECEKNGLPAPVWKSNTTQGVVLILNSTAELEFELSRHQVEILRKCMEPSGIVSLMKVTKRSDRTKFRHQVLTPLLTARLITMTIPEKPRSSNQKYALTPSGKNFLLEQTHSI